MTKKPVNHGKPWTPQQDKQLRSLAADNTPTRVIALKEGRTPAAIATRASEIGVSLKPTNQSPYGTQKR